MRIRSALLVLVVVCTLVAGCDTSVTQTWSAPDIEVDAATSTPPALPPTQTPTPESTPTPTLTATMTHTPTPADPYVSPDGKDISCYFGPGTKYAVDGGLLLGERVPVLGRDEVPLWLQIENPRIPGKNRFCWVPIEKVIVEGDVLLAPILPPPISLVTAVTVELKPKKITATGCVFPVTFDVDFTIQTTGPMTLTFQRSLSTGHTAPAETHSLSAAGLHSYGDYLRVGAEGEHWFMVTVTSPNSISGTGYGKVVCP